ncbi:MAG: hypothetical protein QOD07_301 [Frankiaceae bacterium]|jgi:hypothetical protein|nr:hypothetical protein [Frankiaceae bacterium]
MTYPTNALSVPVRKQGAWGLWWLVGLTCGVYYYIWYSRVNRELARVLGIAVPSDGQWWCQLIPVYNLIGLARTAKRLNEAHARVGSPTRVGVFVTWFWAPPWFGSQTRYLQRRMNILHDVLAAKSVGAAPVPQAVAAPVPAQAVEGVEAPKEIAG